MKFLELTNRVKYTLGLEDTTVNDEVALAKSYINEGIVDILTRTRPYTRVINLVAAANTPVHDLSQQVIALLDLEHPGGRFMERMSREDIGRAQRSNTLGFAYEEPLLWISPIGTEAITYRAYGVFRPSPLQLETDDPALPGFGGLAPEFHPAIVNYALWKGGEYLQHEQSGGGERWRTLYEGQDGTGGDIARIKRILTKRATPAGGRRRDLTRNLGSLTHSGDYLRA